MKFNVANTLFEYHILCFKLFAGLMVIRLPDEVCRGPISGHSSLWSVTMLRSWNWTLSLHWFERGDRGNSEAEVYQSAQNNHTYSLFPRGG